MPGHHRHVHFSSAPTFHSPPAQPSLMSPSGSSEASSFSPLTPPSVPYGGLSGPTTYAPRRSSAGKAHPHNLITVSNTPVLNYDITLHPSSISTNFMGLSAAGFSEPAVYPPQHTLSLATPHLPWAIGVAASNGRYVTVADLLDALYRALCVNVTPAEFSALGTEELMRRASAAYTNRYQRLRGHRGYTEEKRAGVKRVDFLMGYTTFQGISPSACGPDVWQLHTR